VLKNAVIGCIDCTALPLFEPMRMLATLGRCCSCERIKRCRRFDPCKLLYCLESVSN